MESRKIQISKASIILMEEVVDSKRVAKAVELVENRTPWLNDLVGDHIIAEVGPYLVRQFATDIVTCDCMDWIHNVQPTETARGKMQRLCKHILAVALCKDSLFTELFG